MVPVFIALDASRLMPSGDDKKTNSLVVEKSISAGVDAFSI